jgi:hypothetical protein
MITAIIGAVSSIFTTWVGAKTKRMEAEASAAVARSQQAADWDTEAMRQMQYSWKDELITIIWFSPMVVAWFYPEKAGEWLKFVGGMPYWYQVVMFGIVAATFGLRWYFKQQGFKIAKGNE